MKGLLARWVIAFLAQHVFRLTAASDEPPRLGLSFSADDMPRSMEGASRNSPRVVLLPLQLCQASQGR